MKPVGIIANPASGKDIRRLVAYGSVFNNNEKANIIKRLLRAMDSVGVKEVYIMPDGYGLGVRAIDDSEVDLDASLLDMEVEQTQNDSTRAAEMMRDMGAGCIVTLGGDGTNRVVAKACEEIPLVPISTGTNNVFPKMVEGTLAGMVAGIMAEGVFPVADVCRRAPRLEIRRGAELVDIALVDVVVSDSVFIGARAVWDVSTLREIFLARSEPGNIGFSAVGGVLCALPADSAKALHVSIGPGETQVKTPIAPGLIRWLPIGSHRVFEPGESIPVTHAPSTVALDGEREITVRDGDTVSVQISPNGPWVVDFDKVLRAASEKGLFVSDQLEPPTST